MSMFSESLRAFLKPVVPFLDDPSRNELQRLEVALRPARFQTGAFEGGSNILSGSTMPFAAGFTPG